MHSSFDRPDYPALYNAANSASLKSQKVYMQIVKWITFLTIIASFCSLYIRESTEAGIIALILFLAILSLTVYQAVKRFDKIWYNGRAVAESVKTRTWRFVSRAEPYCDCEKINDVKKEFIVDIKNILEQNKDLAEYFSDKSMIGDTITEKMLNLRSKSLEDRLNYYISNRINEQRNWYFTKASFNKRMAIRWFIGLIISHSLVIIFLLIEIGYKFYGLPTAAIIVIGSSIFGWMQIKRYQDLSTSYSLTAHEIGIIKSQSFQVSFEKELSDFVKDAENGFSREHTQWVARKDK